MKSNNAHYFPLLKEFKKLKCNNYIKYAKERKKLTAAFESRFSNLELEKYSKIFEIYSSPFHVEIESAREYLQMELVDLQCNIALKHSFETWVSKINSFNTQRHKREIFQFEKSGTKSCWGFWFNFTWESFFSKMKSTEHKTHSNIADTELQHRLRCTNTQIEINLQKLSEREEKQISHK